VDLLFNNPRGALVLIFVFSTFVQCAVGFFKFKNIVNPISIFNILFFLHNWSYSFGKWLGDERQWSLPESVSVNTQSDVLLVNLVALWIVFGILLFAKNTNWGSYSRLKRPSILLFLYLVFTALFIFKTFIIDGIGGVYGEGQAANSIESFSPIHRLLSLRVIFIAFYAIIFGVRKSKILIAVILLEIFISLLTGGRKALLIIIISLAIPHLEGLRLNFLKVLKIALVLFVASYFLIFISVFRGTSVDTDLVSERLVIAQEKMSNLGENAFYKMLYTANSEGVQNWTYQLLEDEKLEPLMGRSYLQAFLNMIVLRPFQGEIVNWQAAYYFKDVAYPEVTNHGWDFTFTAEAMLNWGVKGSFLSYIFLAMFIVYSYRRRNKDDLNRVLYYITWALLFIHFRTDSTALLRMYSFVIFSYVIVMLLGGKKNISKKSRSNKF